LTPSLLSNKIWHREVRPGTFHLGLIEMVKGKKLNLRKTLGLIRKLHTLFEDERRVDATDLVALLNNLCREYKISL